MSAAALAAIAWRALVALFGALLALAALRSAVRVLIMPRAAPDRLAGLLFRLMRALYDLRLRSLAEFRRRDRLMAAFAPVTLMLLLPCWLSLVLLGFAAMFWAAGVQPAGRAIVLSGSSLFTLGFERADGPLAMALTFAEATIGLILVALLIAYLPTIYGAFARRERAVNLLTVRAGAPVSAVEMLLRLHRVDDLRELGPAWAAWEAWFAEVEESHTSLAALVFFRSPNPQESWVTAAGAVMDGAALLLSTVDTDRQAEAALCIRAGYVALRHIAEYFGLPYDPDPAFPEHPISITRAEFDEARESLAEAGVPLRPDADRAWLDFAGWRVNYDEPLLALASLVMAPIAPWTSDRSPATGRAVPRFSAPRG